MIRIKPWLLYPQGKSPCTHWIGGWVSPKVSMDTVAKRKILIPPLIGIKAQSSSP